jgi:GT2 family glycosyltransferase
LLYIEVDSALKSLVSVIIPHYENLDGLELCLHALERQTYPRDSYEIVVADNMSSYGLEAISDLVAGRARVENVTERGAGAARNGAIAGSAGTILAFTDSDCVPEPGWISAGVAALAHSDVVGGRIEVSVRDTNDMSPTEAFEKVFAFDNKTYIEKKGFTVTANMFCARSTFDTVGGFKVGLSEDFDWCSRALQAGYTLAYSNEAIILHPARRNWNELLSKWRRLSRELLHLYREKKFGVLVYTIRTFALPLSIPIHATRIFWNSDLVDRKDKLSALGILIRIRIWRLFYSLGLIIESQRVQ